MADWPIAPDGNYALQVGAMGASSRLVFVKAGEQYVKGTPAVLTASLAVPASGFIFHFQVPGTSTRWLLDICIGAANQVIVPNLMFQMASERGQHHVYLPIALPAGQAVSVRLASYTAAFSVFVGITALTGGFSTSEVGQVVEAYGITAGTCSGTYIAPSGTVNQKGTPVSLGILARDTSMLVVMVGNQRDAPDTSMNTNLCLFDVYAGTQIVWPDLPIYCNTANDQVGQIVYGPMPFPFPKDTDIKIALQSDSTVAKTGPFEFAAYGIS